MVVGIMIRNDFIFNLLVFANILLLRNIVIADTYDCGSLASICNKINKYWINLDYAKINNIMDTLNTLEKCLNNIKIDDSDNKQRAVSTLAKKRLESLRKNIIQPYTPNTIEANRKDAEFLAEALSGYLMEDLNSKRFGIIEEKDWLDKELATMFKTFLKYVSNDSAVYMKHQVLVRKFLSNSNILVRASMVSTSGDTLSMWAHDLAIIMDRALNDGSITPVEAGNIFRELIERGDQNNRNYLDSIIIATLVTKSKNDTNLLKLLTKLVSVGQINFQIVLDYVSSAQQSPDSIASFIQSLTTSIVNGIRENRFKTEELDTIFAPLLKQDGHIGMVSTKDTILLYLVNSIIKEAPNNPELEMLLDRVMRKTMSYRQMRKMIEKQDAQNAIIGSKLGRTTGDNSPEPIGVVLVSFRRLGMKELPPGNNFIAFADTEITNRLMQDSLQVIPIDEQKVFERMKDEVTFWKENQLFHEEKQVSKLIKAQLTKKNLQIAYFILGGYFVEPIEIDSSQFSIRIFLKLLDFKDGELLGIAEKRFNINSKNAVVNSYHLSSLIDDLFADCAENVHISLTNSLLNKANGVSDGVNAGIVVPTSSFQKGRHYSELSGDSIGAISFDIVISTTYPFLDNFLSNAKQRILKSLQYRYSGTYKILDERLRDNGILSISAKGVTSDSIQLSFSIKDKEFFDVKVPILMNNSELNDVTFNSFFIDMCSNIDNHLKNSDPKHKTIPALALFPSFFPAGSSQWIHGTSLTPYKRVRKLRILYSSILMASQLTCMGLALGFDQAAVTAEKNNNRKDANEMLKYKYGFFWASVGVGVVGSFSFWADRSNNSSWLKWFNIWLD
jgi:hypothetical protein